MLKIMQLDFENRMFSRRILSSIGIGCEGGKRVGVDSESEVRGDGDDAVGEKAVMRHDGNDATVKRRR